MSRFWPRSFFGQLLVGTVVVQTLFLGLFIWYTVVTQRRAAESRARARMIPQLNRLTAVCSADLEANNARFLEDTLELSQLVPTIEVARITDLHGKTIAVTDNGRDRELDAMEIALVPRVTEARVLQLPHRPLEAVAPVRVHGATVALLWLEPTTTPTRTSTAVVQIAITYGGMALLANLLPIFLIAQTVTRPLNKLRSATNLIVHDPKADAGFPLAVTTSNEAGELTTSVNSMVHELEERREGLVKTLAWLDSLLSNAPIGFAFLDRDLRYVRVNDFLAEVHQLSIEAHLGRRPTELCPRSIGIPKVRSVQRVFRTGKAIRGVELSGELAPGVRRAFMMHFYPVRDAQGAVDWVGVIVVEITDRLRAEESLRKTEKLAATGRLAASIAHEINNPLEAVTNILYLLATHEALDEGASQLVSMGQAELARVSEITQQTLRFYRQSTAATEVNVAEVLESILKLYGPRMVAAGIRVETRLAQDAAVYGFGGELRQVFANLVANAVDAMATGGKLRLSARSDEGRDAAGVVRRGVRVFVTDTGTGMSAETMRRVFEAFFTTKETTGTGLGLWVSEEIVRKHAGAIRVRSRSGERSGTSFMIFLPEAGLKDQPSRAA